ncbi:hypothetical protein P0136_04430 [Lentisphaerota bacterium ZTH]|nr:hypothetical protein JYG24_04450 [Lentisphaerota bacterium]WET07241.1 hypothetical protein P0136_04430 [Lentisphaerota bacterium ZTH]
MQSLITEKDAAVKQHIKNNAMKFDLPALLHILNRIGFTSSNILFLPTETLYSQESYIADVKFRSGFVEVFINDINAAVFTDYMKANLPYRPKLQGFFKGMISRLLHDYNTSICPEYKNELKNEFLHGNSLVTMHDGNLKSFSFVHNYLDRLFSDYITVVYKKIEVIQNPYPQLGLGEIVLNPDTILGGKKLESKEFTVIRVITETMLTDNEIKEILNRIKFFQNEFKDILAEINIILENLITDDELYTTLPHKFDYNSYLLQGVVRLLRSHTVNHYGPKK